MQKILSTNAVRKILEECGVPNPALRCVEIVASRREKGDKVQYWELRFSRELIEEVIREGLRGNGKIEEIQEQMRLNATARPPKVRIEELQAEWIKIFKQLPLACAA